MHYIRSWTLFEPLISAPPTAPTAQDKRRCILLTLQDEEERVFSYTWRRSRSADHAKKKLCVAKKNITTAKPRTRIYIYYTDVTETNFDSRAIDVLYCSSSNATAALVYRHRYKQYINIWLHTNRIPRISDLRTVFCRFIVKMFVV